MIHMTGKKAEMLNWMPELEKLFEHFDVTKISIAVKMKDEQLASLSRETWFLYDKEEGDGTTT